MPKELFFIFNFSEIKFATKPPKPLSGSQKLWSIFIEKNKAPKIIDKIKNSSFIEKFSIFFLRIKYPPQIIKLRNIKKAKIPKAWRKKSEI